MTSYPSDNRTVVETFLEPLWIFHDKSFQEVAKFDENSKDRRRFQPCNPIEFVDIWVHGSILEQNPPNNLKMVVRKNWIGSNKSHSNMTQWEYETRFSHAYYARILLERNELVGHAVHTDEVSFFIYSRSLRTLVEWGPSNQIDPLMLSKSWGPETCTLQPLRSPTTKDLLRSWGNPIPSQWGQSSFWALVVLGQGLWASRDQ